MTRPTTRLLARYRQGDQDAFADLVVRYQRPLYNAALWIVRNAEDASDVTQIVFLRVAERLDEYDPQYKFFSWIYRIAVNESLNLLRRKAREEELDEEIELAGRRNRQPGMAGGRKRSSRGASGAALMSMSANDRMVLMLRHFSECSYEEIARHPGPGREDREIAAVRGEAALARVAAGPACELDMNPIRTHCTDACRPRRRGVAAAQKSGSSIAPWPPIPRRVPNSTRCDGLFDELKALRPQAFPPEGLVASVMAGLPAHRRQLSGAVACNWRTTSDDSPIARMSNTVRRRIPVVRLFSGSESMSEQSPGLRQAQGIVDRRRRCRAGGDRRRVVRHRLPAGRHHLRRRHRARAAVPRRAAGDNGREPPGQADAQRTAQPTAGNVGDARSRWPRSDALKDGRARQHEGRHGRATPAVKADGRPTVDEGRWPRRQHEGRRSQRRPQRQHEGRRRSQRRPQ